MVGALVLKKVYVSPPNFNNKQLWLLNKKEIGVIFLETFWSLTHHS